MRQLTGSRVAILMAAQLWLFLGSFYLLFVHIFTSSSSIEHFKWTPMKYAYSVHMLCHVLGMCCLTQASCQTLEQLSGYQRCRQLSEVKFEDTRYGVHFCASQLLHCFAEIWAQDRSWFFFWCSLPPSQAQKHRFVCNTVCIQTSRWKFIMIIILL